MVKFHKLGIALDKKQTIKYEMWWFADKYGFTPAEVRAMSYADRELLKAIPAGIADFEASKPKPPKKVVKPRRGRRRRRR